MGRPCAARHAAARGAREVVEVDLRGTIIMIDRIAGGRVAGRGVFAGEKTHDAILRR